MKLISIYLLTSVLSISHAQVSLDEARSLVDNSSVTVLDIREPDEHATGVAKGMKLIPMSTLESRLNELPRDPNSRVLLICNTVVSQRFSEERAVEAQILNFCMGRVV
jgi:rhodanese-related sulfurtransferase